MGGLGSDGGSLMMSFAGVVGAVDLQARRARDVAGGGREGTREINGGSCKRVRGEEGRE